MTAEPTLFDVEPVAAPERQAPPKTAGTWACPSHAALPGDRPVGIVISGGHAYWREHRIPAARGAGRARLCTASDAPLHNVPPQGEDAPMCPCLIKPLTI